MTTDTRTYCPCWVTPVSLHDGHCCFATEDMCHVDEGTVARRAFGLRTTCTCLDPLEGHDDPECVMYSRTDVADVAKL